MTGRGFERLFFLRVVLCHANGVQILSAFQEGLRWDSWKTFARGAASVRTSAQRTRFIAERVSTALNIPAAILAAIAGTIAPTAQ